jgi:hypothetical protein
MRRSVVILAGYERAFLIVVKISVGQRIEERVRKMNTLQEWEGQLEASRGLTGECR